MLNSKIWYLQRINLFKEIPADDMEELARVTRMESAKKKETIFLPGESSQQVYLLKTGRVKISRVSEEGREITLALLEPGEIFGELEILEGSARDTIAEAMEESQLCVIQKEQFLSLIRKRPELSFRLTKLIGLRLRRIESRVEDLVFRDVPSRLAHLLIQLSENYGKTTPEGIFLNIKITHQEMANLIGSIRETVSATLGEFKKEGLITFEGRKIIILMPELLKKKIRSLAFS
ncbi:MAG TPA: Crp/Fnr family transcriptional regulator [Nitrospiria bacterium]|nr:Crp/Fnr family transcriptional regulator [Nitrospiria bacterium]